MNGIGTKKLVAMLNNPYEGELGGFGLKTYKERAELALRDGVTLVDLRLSSTNVRSIMEGTGANIEVGFWDGRKIITCKVPMQSIKVVFDYAGTGSSGSCDPYNHSKIVAVLNASGTKFVNGQQTESICSDKWSSYELFREIGADTPITMQYGRQNALALVKETGFVFIKDISMSEGRGQFTVSASKDGYTLRSQGNEETFGTLHSALDTIESASNPPTCIVQEGIKMQKIEGRIYDFRALFQLNGNGQIVLPAVYMRLGARGSDQSNISSGGYAQDPAHIFPDFSQIRESIAESGINIFKGLQRRSDYVGEIGMDFLRSSDGRLLVLEINSKSGTKGIRDLAKRDETQSWHSALQEVLRNPIMYAVSMIKTADNS